MKRIVTVVIVGLLAVIAVPPASAHGEESAGESTVEWIVQCWPPTWGGPGPPTMPLSVTSSGPSSVSHGESFTIRLVPGEMVHETPTGPLPDPTNTLSDLVLGFEAPMGAVVEHVEIVPGTALALLGEPTVEIDHTWLRDRIVISAEGIDRAVDGGPTTFRLPAVDLTLVAAGPQSSEISTRVAGETLNELGSRFYGDAGFSFRVEGAFQPGVEEPGYSSLLRCVPQNATLHPPLVEIPITDGPASIDTTTALSVTPTLVAAGENIEITAAVNAPEGAIQVSLGDDTHTAEVSPIGYAHLTIPAPQEPGAIEVSAEYAGAAGYEPSQAPNQTVWVIDPDAFTDIADNDFRNEIAWMAAANLSTGFQPGPEYRPGATLTRQAMSAFIYRLNGSPLGSDPQCESAPFPDVPVTNQFCPQITWMADTGISTGFDDGEYKPFLDLTRRAMSAFLYRYTLVVPTTIV